MPKPTNQPARYEPPARIDPHDDDLLDAISNYRQLQGHYSVQLCIDIAPTLLGYIQKNPHKVASIDNRLTPVDLQNRLKSMIEQCARKLYGDLCAGNMEGYVSPAMMVDEIRVLLQYAGKPLSVLDKTGQTDEAAMDAKLAKLETLQPSEKTEASIEVPVAPIVEAKPSTVITLTLPERIQGEMEEEARQLYQQIQNRDMTGYSSFAVMATRFRETVSEEGWKLNHFEPEKSVKDVDSALILLANSRVIERVRSNTR